MKYNIIPIKQQDEECAPTCLVMALNAFGIRARQEEIIEKIPKETPKWREWLYWIGCAALDYVPKVEVFSMNTQIFDPTWSNLNNSNLAKQLKKELQFVQKILSSSKEPYQDYFKEHYIDMEIWELKSAIAFLKKGGNISIKPTTTEIIKQKLKSGHIAIASVDATIMYNVARGIPKSDPIKGSAWGHVVLIGGYNNANFIIFDPADWYKKKQTFSIPHDRLIEAILRRDQNILFVKK